MSRRSRPAGRPADVAEVEALATELAQDQGLAPDAARTLARLALAPLRLFQAAWDTMSEQSKPTRPPTA